MIYILLCKRRLLTLCLWHAISLLFSCSTNTQRISFKKIQTRDVKNYNDEFAAFCSSKDSLSFESLAVLYNFYSDYQNALLNTAKRSHNSGSVQIEMTDQQKEKIMQPFFTTKPTGEGTGLGLSLSYDIIKVHGGEIKIKTIEGEYTEFTIIIHSKLTITA